MKYLGILEVSRLFISECLPKLAQEVIENPPEKLSNIFQELLKNALNCIDGLVRIGPLKKECMNCRNMILISICLPCLVIREKHENMNATDYCQMKEDIIGNEVVKNVFEASAKVIEAFSDEIDGSFTFLLKNLINVANFSLTANPIYYA